MNKNDRSRLLKQAKRKTLSKNLPYLYDSLQQRKLGESGFYSFNRFLESMTLKTTGDTLYIRDYTPPISTLVIVVSDMTCQDISLQNIEHSFQTSAFNNLDDDNNMVTGSKGEHSVRVKDLHANCNFGYRVENWNLVLNQGRANLKIINTDASLGIEMISRDLFSMSPPTKAKGSKCELGVKIDELGLQGVGAFTQNLIDLLTKQLEMMIRRRFQADFCCEFYAFMDKNMTEILRLVDNEIAPYSSAQISYEDVDVFESQVNLISPIGSNLLDFMNVENHELSPSLTGADSLLAGILSNITDAANKNLGGENLSKDDGINKYMRDRILDENGSFVVTRRDIQSYNSNGMIYRTTDSGVLNAEVYLDHIEVRGLDSFSSASFMKAMSSQLLQNSISLRNLSLKGGVTLKISSTNKNSKEDMDNKSTTYLEFEQPQMIEGIEFAISLDDLNLLLTFLAAIDLNEVAEKSTLNHFLNISCATSFLTDFEVSQLEFSISDVQTEKPFINNFFGSDKLDSFINSAISSQLTMYESVVFKDAMKNFLATTMRENINQLIKEQIIDVSSNKECQIMTGDNNPYVDFRDLLLNKSMAVEYGGSGKEPYGNMISMGLSVFEEVFLIPTTVNGGVPWINMRLIAPITKFLSSTAGEIDLISLPTKTCSDSSELQWGATCILALDPILSSEKEKEHDFQTYKTSVNITKAEIQNFDGFGYPSFFLRPQPNEPHKLLNNFSVGVVDSMPLRFVSHLDISVQDTSITSSEAVPKDYDEEEAKEQSKTSLSYIVSRMFSKVNLEIELELSNLSIVSEIMAKVKQNEFLNFSLKNLSNIQCLISLIPFLEEETTAYILVKEMAVQGTNLNVHCVNCASSTIKEELPQIMKILVAEGSIELLLREGLDFLKDFVNGPAVQNYVSNILKESQEACVNGYDENIAEVQQELFGKQSSCMHVPFLPYVEDVYALESIVYATLIGFQVGTVILPLSIAESQKQLLPKESSSLIETEQEWRNKGKLKGILDLSGSNESLLGGSINRLLKGVNYIFGTGLANMYDAADAYDIFFSTQTPLQYNYETEKEKDRDLFINSIMHGLLSNNVFSIDLSEYKDFLTYNANMMFSPISNASLNIQIKSLNLSGINSFGLFEPFIITGSQTILSKFALDTLTIELEVDLSMMDSSDSLILSFEMKNVLIDAASFVALKEEILSSITLQPLLMSDLDTLLDCVAPAVEYLEIVHFNVSADFKDMKVSGGLVSSNVVKESVSQTFRAIMNLYEFRVKDALHEISNHVLKKEVNKYLQGSFLNSLKESTDFSNCHPVTDDNISNGQFIDWRSMLNDNNSKPGGISHYGDIIPHAISIVRNHLQSSSYSSGHIEPKINDYIPKEFSIPGELFYYQLNLNHSVLSESSSFVFANITNVEVNNINSFAPNPIELLSTDANDPYLIKNSFLLGGQTSNQPLQLGFRIEAGLDDGKIDDDEQTAISKPSNRYLTEDKSEEIREVIDVEIEIENLQVDIDFHVQVNETKFMSLSLLELLTPMCLFSVIPVPQSNEDLTLSVPYINLQYTSLKIRAKCVSCSSPDLYNLDELLSSEEFQDLIQDKSELLLSWILSQSSLNKILDITLNSALAVAKPICAFVTQNMEDTEMMDLSKIFDAIDMNQININEILIESSNSIDFSKLDPSAIDTEKLLSSFLEEESAIKLPDTSFQNDGLNFVIGIFMFLITIYLVSYFVTRSLRKKFEKDYLETMLSDPSSSGEEKLFHLFIDQMVQDAKMKKLNSFKDSILSDEDIPKSVRYGVIVTLIINTVLFAFAHTALNAKVDVGGNIVGQDFIIENAFDFIIGRTLIQAYNNGARLVAIVIMFSSLFWPYIKILATSICWVAPPTKISVQTRGWLFQTLNKLNKWSMMDVFALIMRILIFDKRFVSPDIQLNNNEIISLSTDDEKLYDIWMEYTVLFGLYLNLFSQLVMQLSSEVIVNTHDKSIRAQLAEIDQGISDICPQKNIDSELISHTKNISDENIIGDVSETLPHSDTDETESISFAQSDDDEAIFSDDKIDSTIDGTIPSVLPEIDPPCYHDYKEHTINGAAGKPRKITSVFVYLVFITTLFLLIFGALLPSYSIEIFGIASYIMIAGTLPDSDSTLVSYNLLDIAQGVLNLENEATSVLYNVGLYLFAFVIYLTCLIAPLAQLMTLLVLWNKRLTKRRRDFLFNTLEFWESWQYIDVFFATSLAFSWQGDEFVEYGIDIYCRQLRQYIFPIAVYADLLDQPQARCFVLNIRLQSGIFLLLLSSIMLAFITKFVKKAIRQQNEDLMDHQIKEGEHKEIQGEDFTANISSQKKNHQLNHTLFAELGESIEDVCDVNDLVQRIQKKPLSFTGSFPWFFDKHSRNNIGFETSVASTESMTKNS